MNHPDRLRRLVEALEEHTDLSSAEISELMTGPQVQLDVHEICRIRTRIEEDRKHVYPDGVFGAPCSRCGSREGWREPCLPPQSVRLDRGTALALLDLGEASLSSPFRKLASRLATQLRRRMADVRYCGCDAQDGDVCNSHRALHEHHLLEERMKDEEQS